VDRQLPDGADAAAGSGARVIRLDLAMLMVTSDPVGYDKPTGSLDGDARLIDARHVEPHAVRAAHASLVLEGGGSALLDESFIDWTSAATLPPNTRTHTRTRTRARTHTRHAHHEPHPTPPHLP
jgi:hypothetical protein